MAKYTQEVLLQMDLFKYPFDISCVSNRHLKLNMSQVKLLIFPPNPALFAILLSIYGNSTPLPGTPLLLSWPPAHSSVNDSYGHLLSKYIQECPQCTYTANSVVQAKLLHQLTLGQMPEPPPSFVFLQPIYLTAARVIFQTHKSNSHSPI